MPSVPSPATPVLDQAGNFTPPWVQFFAGLVNSSGPAVDVDPTGSPFVFRAPQGGHLLIHGGTVSDVRLIRGRVNTIAQVGFVPVSQGDTVQIAYSVAPTLTFIPG